MAVWQNGVVLFIPVRDDNRTGDICLACAFVWWSYMSELCLGMKTGSSTEEIETLRMIKGIQNRARPSNKNTGRGKKSIDRIRGVLGIFLFRFLFFVLSGIPQTSTKE